MLPPGNNERQALQLVMACDGGFAMPLATALRSIAENNRRHWPIDVHVLFHRFPEDLQGKVADSVPAGSLSIRWIAVDVDAFETHSASLAYPPVAYARLLVPRIFSDDTHRLLYLDADLLVLDDLAPLWTTDLRGAAIGAVLDTTDGMRKRGAPDTQDIPQVQDYFNSGVLLVDLPRWRAKRVSERALEYLAANSTRFPDQDALNVVCDGEWSKLEPSWNFQGHRDTCLWELEPAQRPAIVHFVTAMKPWKFDVPTLNASFFDSYRNRTKFARTNVQRVRDLFGGGLSTAWTHFKFGLKKHRAVRAMWNRVKSGRDSA